MACFDPKQIMQAMPCMLDMAKAGNTELAETADIAANILKGMNLPASDASRLGDVLVGTFTRANTNLAMLGETMKYVGPVASSAGQGIETVAAMAGKLAEDGIKGIAGEEAVAGLQTLVKYAGSGELQQFISTLKLTQGEAAKVAKVMVGDLDELSSAWEDLGIQIQEQQNGPLREITQTLADVVGGIKSWIVENPELAAQIVKTAAGIGLLLAGMGGLTLAMASILGPFAMVRYGMMLFGIRSFSLFGSLLKLGRVALPLVAQGIMWIGRALLMNPIGLAVTAIAIAAAAYLIYKNWEPIKAFVLGIWAEIKAGFDGGLSGIAQLILNFSPIGLFYRAFAAVMNYFGIDMPGKFTEFGSMLMQGMVNGITAGLGRVKEAITGAGESSINWFKEKLGIHSPSRVFAGLGGFTMAGLAQGLAGGEGDVLKQIAGTAKRLTDSGAALFGIDGSGISVENRAPISARCSASGPRSGDTYNFTINAAPGMDAAAIGREVQRQLTAAQNQQQARNRGRLSDQD